MKFIGRRSLLITYYYVSPTCKRFVWAYERCSEPLCSRAHKLMQIVGSFKLTGCYEPLCVCAHQFIQIERMLWAIMLISSCKLGRCSEPLCACAHNLMQIVGCSEPLYACVYKRKLTCSEFSCCRIKSFPTVWLCIFYITLTVVIGRQLLNIGQTA